MPEKSYFDIPNCKAAMMYLLAFFWCMPILDASATSTSERSNLGVILRQLIVLEETTNQSSQIAIEPSQRYSFDYQRLAEDIARIRHGINDYLSPHRAQPRDPVELSGSYTMEARKP